MITGVNDSTNIGGAIDCGYSKEYILHLLALSKGINNTRDKRISKVAAIEDTMNHIAKLYKEGKLTMGKMKDSVTDDDGNLMTSLINLEKEDGLTEQEATDKK